MPDFLIFLTYPLYGCLLGCATASQIYDGADDE